MTSVAVLIPWAGSCPHREAARQHVRAWYAANFPEWKIHWGESGEGPAWCKAQAVAFALCETNAKILVVADADCIAPGLGEAVRQVSEGAPWAVPHRLVHRFSQGATARILAGEDPSGWPRERALYDQMPYPGYEGGGIVVLRRDVYEQLPLDPRFMGWGQEDEAWATALSRVHGKPWRRTNEPLWHLWHPPQKRMSRSTGSHAGRALLAHYRKLYDPEAMVQQLAPARAYLQAVYEANLVSNQTR